MQRLGSILNQLGLILYLIRWQVQIFCSCLLIEVYLLEDILRSWLWRCKPAIYLGHFVIHCVGFILTLFLLCFTLDCLVHQTMTECSICLESCVQPVKLPCGHVFCFLCVKGVADRCQKCAICRRSIPANYFDHPVLVEGEQGVNMPAFDGGYQWFYEGKNGWWLYDPRTSADMEEAFKSGQPQCQLLIAGHLYYIDFARMVQYRSEEPGRRRKIKRDAIRSTVTKGIAGLKNSTTRYTSSGYNQPTAPPMSPPPQNIPAPQHLPPQQPPPPRRRRVPVITIPSPPPSP